VVLDEEQVATVGKGAKSFPVKATVNGYNWRGRVSRRAGFDGLAFSHRKEYARWIGEAKKEETRERRVAKALEKLREGKPPK
jgi:Bacteriocin-protection, YdeI or OmpD-Associated